MKASIACALLVSGFSLSACLPFSEVRFFEMKGRVIDADTHMPIAGARVAIHVEVSAEGYSLRVITATSSTSSYDQPRQCFILHDILLQRTRSPEKPNQSPEPTR